MKILTQTQAQKEFPQAGYSKYDPMIMVVGSPKEFVSKFQIELFIENNKNKSLRILLNKRILQTKCTSITRLLHVLDGIENCSLDYVSEKQIRLVIWK